MSLRRLREAIIWSLAHVPLGTCQRSLGCRGGVRLKVRSVSSSTILQETKQGEKGNVCQGEDRKQVTQAVDDMSCCSGAAKSCTGEATQDCCVQPIALPGQYMHMYDSKALPEHGCRQEAQTIDLPPILDPVQRQGICSRQRQCGGHLVAAMRTSNPLVTAVL